MGITDHLTWHNPESDIEPLSAQSSLRVRTRTPGFTHSAFSVASVVMSTSVLGHKPWLDKGGAVASL